MVTYLILLLERRGFRPVEAVITVLVGLIALCYVVETFLSRPAWGQIAYHSVIPWEGNSTSVLLCGYHRRHGYAPRHLSAFITYPAPYRPAQEKEAKRIFHLSIPDVVIALGLAGLINMAMLYMAASTFHAHGLAKIVDMGTAYQTLTRCSGAPPASLWRLTTGLRALWLGGRHHGWPGDHAGVRRLRDTGLAPAAGYHAARRCGSAL